MNHEAKKAIAFALNYGASAQTIRKIADDLKERPYQPRRRGLLDSHIYAEKKFAVQATLSQKVAIMGRKEALLYTHELQGPLAARKVKPGLFQGAHNFRSCGDFSGVPAVGFAR